MAENTAAELELGAALQASADTIGQIAAVIPSITGKFADLAATITRLEEANAGGGSDGAPAVDLSDEIAAAAAQRDQLQAVLADLSGALATSPPETGGGGDGAGDETTGSGGDDELPA